MNIRDTLFTLFNVREAHELPAAMMKTIEDPEDLERIRVAYLNSFPDLHHDYLRDYFEENAADRSTLKQDYTPDGICQLMSDIIGKRSVVADICAGSGALTLSVWDKNPDTIFVCYEKSSSALPLLLLNLAIRSVNAFVVYGDVLTEEYEAIYRVKDGTVTKTDEKLPDKVDAVITNPPYSLGWSGQHDLRFGIYPAPPKSKADYAFVLIGLEMLKENGILAAILPHGVLFRGSAEGKVREGLCKDGKIHAVIGLPEKLFLSTGIPTVIAVLSHQKEDGIFFVDASKDFKKGKQQNILCPDHIHRIWDAFNARREEPKFSRYIYPAEIEENDYNLNIPRYVDSFERDPVPDPIQTLKNLQAISLDIQKTEKALMGYIDELVYTGNDKNAARELCTIKEEFRKLVSL